MGNISYKPLIEDMTWSFSRVESFCDCPYRWYLKYLRDFPDEDRFFTTYGSFMHRLLEGYYKGEMTKEDMLLRFLTDFSSEVRGSRPAPTTLENYIEAGRQYLESFEPFLYRMVSVEEEIHFSLDGIPFVGYIDYLGELDGEYFIIDHKSRNLKPRSHRKKPTLSDMELDEKLRQLYLYSTAVKERYGVFPKSLCFNCFRDHVFIEEPFSEDAYHAAVSWAVSTIREIENEESFSANPEFFKCRYICGVSDYCDRKDDIS